VATHFGDSAGELTTSITSSRKGGNFSTNRSDLDKNNIIKHTFEPLTEEGCKVFEAYHANLEELSLSRYEMTWQGTILKDSTSIVICKAKVTPEVQTNLLLSLNDDQSMINSVLER
jgi:hypothetical protein